MTEKDVELLIALAAALEAAETVETQIMYLNMIKTLVQMY